MIVAASDHALLKPSRFFVMAGLVPAIHVLPA
jgi:hypothetical protein